MALSQHGSSDKKSITLSFSLDNVAMHKKKVSTSHLQDPSVTVRHYIKLPAYVRAYCWNA